MSEDFVDNSAKLAELMKRGAARGLNAIGLRAVTHAKHDTPVDTGRLRNSITHTVYVSSHDEMAAYVGSNVEYAPYVELGARGRPGVYMLRKAATEHKEEYSTLLTASIRAEISE